MLLKFEKIVQIFSTICKAFCHAGWTQKSGRGRVPGFLIRRGIQLDGQVCNLSKFLLKSYHFPHYWNEYLHWNRFVFFFPPLYCDIFLVVFAFSIILFLRVGIMRGATFMYEISITSGEKKCYTHRNIFCYTPITLVNVILRMSYLARLENMAKIALELFKVFLFFPLV